MKRYERKRANFWPTVYQPCLHMFTWSTEYIHEGIGVQMQNCSARRGRGAYHYTIWAAIVARALLQLPSIFHITFHPKHSQAHGY